MKQDIVKRLADLKAQIEREKAARAELQGELKTLMKQLKEDFGISSLSDADKKIAILERDIDVMEAELEKKVREIERIMESVGDD